MTPVSCAAGQPGKGSLQIRGPRISVAHSPEESASAELTERDARILAFERQWWRHAGAKEEAIRADFGLSAARYYQVLNALLDSPAAIVHDPMLVKRLRRMRDARTEARSARIIRGTTPSPTSPITETALNQN
jgi:hypothetical protein